MSNQVISTFGEGQAKSYPKDHVPETASEPFHEGKHKHEHDKLDSKDQRSLKNRLAAYEHDEKEEKKHENDPTPQHYKEHEKRGRVIDEQLEEEDAEKIKEMDEKKHHEHEKKHHHGHNS